MKKFEGKLLWNGRNYVTATNYSECERETLYYTRGKWRLNIFSICPKDNSGQWKELSKAEAAKWLVINGYEPHPDVEQEYLELRLDPNEYYKYPAKQQRKTMKARQRVVLTDGTGRWFDLANAVQTNLFSKPDIVWNKDKTAYFYVEKYTVKGIPIIHFWLWTNKEADHRWFLKRDIQNDFSFYDEKLFNELYVKYVERKSNEKDCSY